MNKVIIYSKNNCQPCNLTKLYLAENDIEFEERNISTSETHMKELQELGYQSVPITLVNGTVVANGFEPWKLEAALQEETK